VPVVCTSNCGGGGGANANISAVKTVDKTTVNVGDNITYTITVKNSGPDLATGVKVTDTLPGGLNFISATSTFGSYSTTTSIWTIGSMANGSSTSLTIVASVKTGTEGQKITNSAVASADQTDSTPSDNTTSVDTTVNSPVCTSNCGGGGGGGTIGNGGGGGGGNGPIIPNNLTIFNEQVIETVPGIAMITWNTNLPATRRVVYSNTSHSTLGDAPNYGYDSSTDLVSTPLLTAHGVVVSIDPGKVYYFRAVSTDSAHSAVSKELQITRGTVVVGNGGITEAPSACYYLHDYLRKDFNNNPVEVKKLQIFLRDLEGFSNLQVTGVYDEATIAATDAFQIRYKGDVLTPWGYDGTKGTDYTYILTKKKVNEIYCKMAFPVTAQQQAEIDSTRNFFQSLRNEGININTQNTTQPAGNENNVPLQNNVVGQGPEPESTITPDLTTMAGISTTTNSITSRFTANVLYAGKNLVNLAFLPFLWPFSNTALSSACFPSFSGWLNIILILIILVILYMWYREYRNNRRIEDINKEIDLK
jgi:uncharacterized repeat protein (TIGR01451 family)